MSTGTAHGLADEVTDTSAGQWVEHLRRARDEGYGFFDMLDAVDEVGRADEVRLVARLVDFSVAPPRGLQLHVRLPREDPHVATATTVFPGAGWYEREVHDMFGVRFDGGDQAPLLNHAPGTAPLRKDVVVAARAAQPWPGAKEPGEDAAAPSRRRMAPPGVPDPAVWGDRPPGEEAPSAEELVAAVTGGRVRRRR